MMSAGEFSNPTNWIRTGNAIQIVDDYARAHRGAAPVLVFVDSSGSFNNDTECVNGPRGNAADHLTREVRPYLISQFAVSVAPADWAVVGWSAGGTCAIDLAVTHPELFMTFEDIGGDRGPNSGTKQQTIDRLYGGDAAGWEAYDPRTVMARHGPYSGVAGYFDDSQEPADGKSKNLPDRPQDRRVPVGFGGHGDEKEFREKCALPDLCAAAMAVTSDAYCGCTPAVTHGSSAPAHFRTRCRGSPSGSTHRMFLGEKQSQLRNRVDRGFDLAGTRADRRGDASRKSLRPFVFPRNCQSAANSSSEESAEMAVNCQLGCRHDDSCRPAFAGRRGAQR